MGLFSWLFGNKQKHTIRPRLLKVNDDLLYENNDDVITGYKYFATLHISTPLEILKNHGKIFNGPPSEVPAFGDQADGCWLPEINPEYDLGSDMVGSVASDIGPITEEEYIPFLIDFRKAIENDVPPTQKIEQLQLLEKMDKYKSIWKKLDNTYNDFPQSFFYSTFTEIQGIGIKVAKNIYEAGFISIDELLLAKESDLLKISGLGKASIQKIKTHKQ